AIDSAKRSFEHANDAVFGNVTHVLKGGPRGIDERLLTQLRLQWPTVAAAPVVLEQVSAGIDDNRRRLQLMGIDPFVDAAFRSHSPSPESILLPRFLSQSGSVVLSSATAAREGVAIGDDLSIHAAGRSVRLHVIGVLDGLNELQNAALEQVLLVDISTAQEVLGMVGRLSRIDLNVASAIGNYGHGQEHGQDNGTGATLPALKATLPADVRVEAGSATARVREQMTRAFYLNLRMLSVLALVVGLFIIYNAMSFSVVQRRSLFGTLRAIGVTGRELVALVLCEALLLALAATALGVPLGIVLADVLLNLVTRTVDDLYFLAAVGVVHVDVYALAPAIALGLLGSLLAAAIPALEATVISARAAMSPSYLERRVSAAVPMLAGAGVCAALLSALLLAGGRSDNDLASAFAALFALVTSAVLLAPALICGLVRLLQAMVPVQAGAMPLMALRGLRAGMSRTAVAIVALMVALATTVGVAVMVSSFRVSLQDWLQETLSADIYIAVAGRGMTATLPEDLAGKIAALQQVQSVAMSRDLRVRTDHGEVALKAMTETPDAYRGLTMTSGFGRGRKVISEALAWQALGHQVGHRDAVLISEPFSRRTRLGTGDVVRLHSDLGVRSLHVAGVFRDYASEHGLMIMGIGAYRAMFGDAGISGLAIALLDDADATATVAEIERMAGTQVQLRVRAQAAIRDASVIIFDRTFAITRVLQWLATLVACVGVLSALTALALERGKEMAVLRAQGMTRGNLLVLLQCQSLAMGLIAGLLALPLGTAMALVLTHVINRRAFGWSMEFHLPLEVLGHTVLIAVIAALLAGLYPAWRLSRSNPAQALRLS
ncbi:MAG: putative ABC transport system permease protein, partial [Gammaproteobacteria bacterium]